MAFNFPNIDPSQFSNLQFQTPFGSPPASMAPQMPPQAPQTPVQAQMAPQGMFGGGRLQNALMAAAAGFLARTRPGMAQSLMQGVQDQRTLNRQSQLAMLKDNLDFQRQMQLAQANVKLKLQYPDGDFATSLIQSGIYPGTPEWTHAMQTHVQNELDPAVVTPKGMMLRSQITGALQPPSAPVGKLTPLDGGPTPPASDNFPY
jgi:hypothetical protein